MSHSGDGLSLESIFPNMRNQIRGAIEHWGVLARDIDAMLKDLQGVLWSGLDPKDYMEKLSKLEALLIFFSKDMGKLASDGKQFWNGEVAMVAQQRNQRGEVVTIVGTQGLSPDDFVAAQKYFGDWKEFMTSAEAELAQAAITVRQCCHEIAKGEG